MSSVLKKEFKEKDVERIRNLVRGKYGDKTTTSVGYSKIQEEYHEGDVWEVDGKKWTIKNGIKQSITKLNTDIHFPLFCPACTKIMKKNSDKLFYYQYKRCTDCQINFETDLKKKGLWDIYEKNIVNLDIDNIIKDFEIWYMESINQSNESFITEAGDIEKWIGSIKDKLLENKEDTIKFLQSLKK